MPKSLIVRDLGVGSPSRQKVEGLESSPEKNTEEPGFLQEGGAKSGALGVRAALLEADLARWVDACPVPLDDETKASISGMIAAASERQAAQIQAVGDKSRAHGSGPGSMTEANAKKSWPPKRS